MKAVIEESELSFQEKIRWYFKEKNKGVISFAGVSVLHYRIPDLKNPSGLIRELHKKNVAEIVIKNIKNEKTVNALSCEFSVLNCKRLMIQRLEELLIKIVKLMGIRDGKLSLGLMVEPKDIPLIFALRSIRDRVKYIYFYCQNTTAAEEAADRFYDETGVGVVVRNYLKKDQVDFLIYKGGGQKEFPKDLNMVLNLSDENKMIGLRTIEDVKLSMPHIPGRPSISDLEAEALFSQSYPIKGFIMA